MKTILENKRLDTIIEIMRDKLLLQAEQEIMRIRLSSKRATTNVETQMEDLRRIANTYLTLRSGTNRNVLSVRRYIVEEMHRLQNGLCVICSTPIRVERGTQEERSTKAHLDHDHSDNSIRGLLCGHCNLMIGFAQDSPAILKKAAQYLESYEKKAPSERIFHTVRITNKIPSPPRERPTILGTCVVNGCSQNKRSNGMCPMHYARWRKTGDANTTPKGRTPIRHLVEA